MSDLTGLPEIGRVTAAQLQAVGIPDAATLRRVGAREAFSRIRAELDPGACVRLLTGLECAVRGVSARTLSEQDRADSRDWFRALSRLEARPRPGAAVDPAADRFAFSDGERVVVIERIDG
ncbi:MAG: TfoX/Sxy family protein [Propionibacteriaceae bacterium]|nr:TfoX/Sxy family protein [Propionibacteriaceae bacterium]